MTIVEMALCTSVLVAMLFGIFEVAVALFSFQLVGDAAREGSRFAMVRGSSCQGNFNLAYCSPTDANTLGATNNDIQTYVTSLNYPGHSQLTTSTAWFSTNGLRPAIWSECDPSKTTCTTPGNQVQVTVTYNYALNIPFVPSVTIPITSTSSEVITQ